MSLDKRVVTVPLIDGLSGQDDPFAGDPPGWQSLNDARWGRDKVIGKRFGLEVIAEPGDGQAISSALAPNGIVDLDGIAHLIAAQGTYRDGDQLHSEWAPMNLTPPRASRVVSDPLVRLDLGIAKCDAAVVGDVVCAVWEQIALNGSVAGAFYAFWDISSDVPRPIAGPTQFATIKEACRVVALENRYFIATGLDADANGHIYTTACDILSGAPWTFNAPALLDQVSSNHYGLGVDEGGSFAYLCYLNFAGPLRRLHKLNVSGTSTANKTMSALGVQHVLHNGPIAQVFVIGPNGDLSYCADNLGGAVTNVNPFVDPASGYYTGRFFRASIGRANAAGDMWAARSTSGPYAVGADPYATQILALDHATKAASGQQLLGGIVLTAHFSPYIDKIGTSLLGVGNQGAFYTNDSDPTVTAISQREAYKAEPVGFLVQPVQLASKGNLVYLATWARYGQDAMELFGNGLVGSSLIKAASSHLPHLAYYAASTTPAIVSAYISRIGDVLGGTAGNVKRQVDLVRASVSGVRPVRNVNAQALRILGSGAGTTMIDGQAHDEMTPAAPEWITFDGYEMSVLGNVAAFHVPAANARWWGFVVVWQYTDARGNVHRSGPSSVAWTRNTGPASELIDAAGHGGKLVFPPWNPCALIGDKGVCEACIYACPYDGNGDFRLLGIVKPPADTVDEGRVYVLITNGGTITSFSVDVSTWDSVRPVPRSLYTGPFAGSELEATPSPPLLSICSTQSRLWGLNGEDRLDVWYTKPIALGYAPEWNSTLRVRVPQDGGPAVGIAALDDKVVVFKQRKVFVIDGDPGDAAGNASSLRPPRLVSSDVGCISVESIVEGPFGVLFLSERGFYTLDRGLSYNFVGDKVLDEMGTAWSHPRVVQSAALVPSESEVRIVTATAPQFTPEARSTLVWNYRFNRWCRRDGLAPSWNATVDGVEWTALDLGVDGNVIFAESVNDWTYIGPFSAPLLLTGRTSWIKMNGIAGYGRLWRAVFVFRWFKGSTTGLRIRTAQDYATDSEAWRTWTAADLGALAGSADLVELAVKPTVQKCEVVQFIIEEIVTQDVTPAGRGIELVGVTVEVGVKRGAYKRLGTAARK